MSDAERQPLRFDEFELDEGNARLTRRGEPLQLPPKAFAVLCALTGQAGQLITKDALLDAVWGHRHVSESVLKTTISQVRAALSDSATQPRYIETVSRRGYRFNGRIVRAANASAPMRRDDEFIPAPPVLTAESIIGSTATSTVNRMVGRRSALAQMQAAWTRASDGRRELLWIAGDAGVGKSTLIEAFTTSLHNVVVAHGQCVEQHGAGEPYLPVLEALGSLCRRFPELPSMMRTIAPTWLLQLPWLSSETDRAALHRELAGVNQDRMVRELMELIERFTAQQPLLFIIEDLHWSDSATLRLMDHFARRRGSMRMLWLGSFRLTQMIAEAHPLQQLRQELRLHRLCEEIVLDSFSETEVAEYLASRAPGTDIAESLVHRLYNHTDGLPLFVCSVVDTLMAEAGIDALQQAGNSGSSAHTPWIVPDNLAGAMEAQIARLPNDVQALLEAASICGMEFRVATVAEALEKDPLWLSARCDELVRRQYWLRHVAIAALPDGSLDARYAFRHALYRHVFYQRAAVATRVRLHRRVALSMERSRTLGITVTSAELASQFESGLVFPAALRHYADAARNALSHFAPMEAMNLTGHALELLPRCKDGTERMELELALVAHRGVACSQLYGLAAPETYAVFERAQVLCDILPQTPGRALMLNGLAWAFFVRGEYGKARSLAARIHELAVSHEDLVLRVCACSLMGVTLVMHAELHEACRWLEEGIAASDQLGAWLPDTVFIVHPTIMLRTNLSVPLLHLGLLDQARAQMNEAYRRAEQLGQPMARMTTTWNLAMLEMRMQHPERVSTLADALIQIVTTFGLGQGEGPSRWTRGWADAHLGNPRQGHQRILEGYALHQRTGMHAGCAEALGYAAEALLLARELEAAYAQAEEALNLAKRLGERILFPFLLMLQARIMHGQGRIDTARLLMHEALAEGRAQQSLWHQLRALTLLCELSGAAAEEFAALRAVCEQFREGSDVASCIKARALVSSKS